jgi:hypothetical protein
MAAKAQASFRQEAYVKAADVMVRNVVAVKPEDDVGHVVNRYVPRQTLRSHPFTRTGGLRPDEETRRIAPRNATPSLLELWYY